MTTTECCQCAAAAAADDAPTTIQDIKSSSHCNNNNIKDTPKLTFHLTHERPSKTIDLGNNNGTSVALGPLGSVLQLSTFHPCQGIVVASPYEQFDGNRFRDQQYVRSYRKHMLNSVRGGIPGFGLRFNDAVHHVAIDFQAANLITVSFPLPGGLSVALSVRVEEDGELVQSAVVTSSSTSNATVRVGYTLDLGISVNRASYGQLTEAGPIPIPKSQNQLKMDGGGKYFSITNPHLEAHLEGCLEADGITVNLDHVREQVAFDLPINAESTHWLDMPPASERVIVARLKLFPDTELRHGFDVPLCAKKRLTAGMRQVWLNNATLESFIIRRNLEYILGCLVVPVSHEQVALMTDHVALPLGWNRDNYWQLWFILNVRRNLDSLVLPEAISGYRNAIDQTAKGHLLWVFRGAQRPHGYWHRSYLVTGKPKDGPTFQLDQQCYPLLELCDFYDNYPEETELVQKILSEGVPGEILELLWSKRDPVTSLFPTDETPGDDKVEYPFHFSSHVLLWYTLSRMTQLLKEVGMPSSGLQCLKPPILQSRAQELRSATLRHFVTQNKPSSVNGHVNSYNNVTRIRETIFAYLCDGQGQQCLYHDANDIPTLLAAKWNFIPATRELGIWKDTMDWALSPSNALGYFGSYSCDNSSSPFAGLGSVHTPDPWPLGFFQEFLYANMTGDSKRQRDAWRRIRNAMLFDGTFSEAVDARTGESTSKSWFSWPGCMIGSALIPSLKEKVFQGAWSPDWQQPTEVIA